MVSNHRGSKCPPPNAYPHRWDECRETDLKIICMVHCDSDSALLARLALHVHLLWIMEGCRTEGLEALETLLETEDRLMASTSFGE